MIVSFILLNVTPSAVRDVFNALSKIPEIVEHHTLFGEYDLIAKVECEDFATIGRIVTEGIRSIPGVIDTKTLPGISFEDDDS